MREKPVENFFDVEKNVLEYVEMCEGMDGGYLISILKRHFAKDSLLLEIGMGPGTDLEILGESYNVTGSDASKIFLDLYKKRNPLADLLLLDAVTLETDRKFDCVFSNKVLHHLMREDLPISIARQKQILNNHGLIFHSFWRGNGEEVYRGLQFVKYEFKALLNIFSPHFEIIESGFYAEMNLNDSIYILGRKRI